MIVFICKTTTKAQQNLNNITGIECVKTIYIGLKIEMLFFFIYNNELIL